jgi:probable rRNA maturation factor
MPDSEDPLIFLRVPRGISRAALRQFAARIGNEIARGASFRCLLTDDRELRRLNREFLGKDYPTDVLAFPEPGPDGFLGELAISVERAREQALAFGHSLEDELRILMLHGLLHVTGMDHVKDGGHMARSEKKWRRHFGLPVGLIERVI